MNTIVCPSGLQLQIRGMKAKELALLAAGGEDDGEEKVAKKKGKNTAPANPIGPILAQCSEVIDAGPYTPPFSWSKVLIADRFFALLQIRIATWGSDYEFKVRCRDASCTRHKKPFVWAEDLSALEIKALPDDSRAKVRNGDLTFEFELGGKRAKFALQTGADESRVLPSVPRHKELLAQLAGRLTYVEGQDVTKWDALLDWIGELDMPEVVNAREHFDDVDGGVQTNTMVACPDCELEFDVPIPFEALGFLLPERKTSASRPASTSAR